MIAAPSFAMLALVAALSFNAALILRKRWMRIIAACCGTFEIAAMIFLAWELMT